MINSETRPHMRVRIRESAARLMSTRGISGITIRAIARDIGASPTAIYKHFPNRDAILTEVWELGFGELAREMEKPIDSEDCNERILTLTERYVRWAVGQPEVFDLMYAFDPNGLNLLPRDTPASNPAIVVLLREIRGCVDSGNWRKENLWDLAVTVWAQGKGLISLYRSSRIDVSGTEMPELCRRSMKLLIEGLVAAPARAGAD
jgi:AcrR family transcriptional regulator